MTDGRRLTEAQTARVVAIAMDLARAGETDRLADFLDHGLPVDVLDPAGNSLLMLASYHGRAATVRMLLERGANPDTRNARDQSPIAGALFIGDDEVVAVLLEAGADVDAGTPSAREAAALFGRGHLLER